MRRFALVLLASAALAQEGPSDLAARFLAQEQAAFAHYRAQEWPQAVAAFERQAAIYADNPRPYYNIACCYALQGDAERAATWLRLSIARGWRDEEHLAADPDFDRVRETEAYRSCVAELRRARARDPDPLPGHVAPETVPGASSAGTIVAASEIQERLLWRSAELLGEHEFRKRLFRVYDRRIALLTRYLAENGDARDADTAAHARVRTGMLYLEQASGRTRADRRLELAAARYVDVLAEEFLRGWSGSPYAPEVLLWRAHASMRRGAPADAVEADFRSLLADHPEDPAAAAARVELCALFADRGRREDAIREYEALDEATRILHRNRLLAARLFARGLPDSLSPRDGLRLYVFVATGDAACARRLEELRASGLPVVVLCVDETPDESWLSSHAEGAHVLRAAGEIARDLGLTNVPTVLLARDGRVLAIDPSEEELRDTE